MSELTDWKRNNKVCLRNFSEACDFHDIVKTLIMRMLRRKYPNSEKNPIYSEYDPDKPNQQYPDIWMRGEKKSIIVWEIQDSITKDWKERMISQYENVDLIIVPLKELDKENIKNLKKQLKEYII